MTPNSPPGHIRGHERNLLATLAPRTCAWTDHPPARALGPSIFTEADTLADLHADVRDAVRCHFDEGESPKVIRLHFVRDDVISA